MEMSKKFGRIQRNFSSISKHRRNDHAHQLEQALDILMDHVTQGRTERKPLEQCLGLVLSQDVFALLDMPPFSRSARMDMLYVLRTAWGRCREPG